MNWPTIKPGDIIDIIAPSGWVYPKHLPHIQMIPDFLASWGLKARIQPNMIGDHPFLANTDHIRLEQLKNALYTEDSSLVWCLRGGHGATRLIPDLLNWQPPKKNKLLVGFSDITALHLWINQFWHWPSLHAPMARQVAAGEADIEDMNALKHLWFNGLSGYQIQHLQPMNQLAREAKQIEGETTGTCLSLIATSLGTPWQVKSKGKILLLEDINEAPYQLDRLFVFLTNAGVFNDLNALVLGDLGESVDVDKQQILNRVLDDIIHEWFSRRGIQIPIYRVSNLGHGNRNVPLPLGVKARIQSSAQGYCLSF